MQPWTHPPLRWQGGRPSRLDVGSARGFGKSRQPLSEAQTVDRVALQRVLRCILADFGVVDAPVEGCAPRTGNMERDKVEQVTAAVMQKLRERGVV